MTSRKLFSCNCMKKKNKKQTLGGDCDGRNKNPVGEIKNQEKANKRLFYRFAAI